MLELCSYDKETKVMKLFKYISYFTLIIAFIFIGIVFYWLLYPYKTIKINSANLQQDTYNVGDTLVYNLDFCRYTKVDTHINRRFVDGLVFAMPDATVNNPIGCYMLPIGIQIPQTLPSGVYLLEVKFTYHVNPIREITHNFQLGPINIINNNL